MATQEITKENIGQTIAENDIVLFDFWADWCGPCKNFAPVYEAASEKNPDIVFGKIDTEAQQELAAAFQIQSIPTIMAFREGVGIFSEAGALPAEGLDQLIEGIKGVDMEEVHAQVAAQQAEAEKGEAPQG
ncbi:thioredoxin [Brevibacterium litoralis]|uniref:thioredoxin n=1 Tax=Brevibacterium litoralis TaxID=3138935 RepID=UPI0032EC06C5